MRPPPGERSLSQLLSFGVLNLDKPPGPPAHQVSAWVREMVGGAGLGADLDRAAHAGTLDPKVTGCLPVLLGGATRLAPALVDGRKEYVAVLQLHAPAPSDLAATVAAFEGEIHQKPPRKSAVARRLRSRRVDGLDVLEAGERRALLRVRCESGTYVRKLCHDLGLALGTGAHMGDLRRTGAGPFDDADLATMHDLADALAAVPDEEAPLRAAVAPAERALADLPRVTVAPSAAEQVAQGAPVYAPGVLDADDGLGEGELLACYTPGGTAVCLGRLVGDPGAERGEVVALERVLV